jgi:2-keto-4-pentenoate hydratase
MITADQVPSALVQTAATLVAARRNARPLPAYPGTLPATPDAAYSVQRHAIDLWSDRVAGWKVGRMSASLTAQFGANRFIGPVFAGTVQAANGRGQLDFPMFEGGVAAFEAEFVAVLDGDADPSRFEWTVPDARALVRSLHIGVEVAGSPLTALDDLDSLATIAAFGNNAGQILGPAIPHWHDLADEALACTSRIDGTIVGAATAAGLPGGPMAALAFALGQAARLGRPLKAGDFVSTGAVTGVHPVKSGQHCSADFGAFGTINCIARAIRAS